jgi:uncharacterized protein involved in exopolysaccharide biosynthesis
MDENKATTGRFAPGAELAILVWKKKKIILFIVLISALLATLFSDSYFLAPVYKSEVILYPPGTNSNKILIENDPRFGSDIDVEQQIQILKSGMVRDSVIRKYNLADHYKIDPSYLYKRYKLLKEYESNVWVERTRYNSISVTVFDTDPVLAAAMANDIVNISDRVKSQVLKQNIRQAFHSLEKEYKTALAETDALADKINSIIRNPLAVNVFRENKPDGVQLKEQIDLQQAIGEARRKNENYLLGLLYDYQNKLQRLMELRWSYNQAAGYINLDVPACYIISPAEVNYKKDSPNRFLIVLMSVLCSLLMSTGVWLVIVKVKNYS